MDILNSDKWHDRSQGPMGDMLSLAERITDNSPKDKGTKILGIRINPWTKESYIGLHLATCRGWGQYLIAPFEATNITCKPPCLYGME